MQHQRSSSTFSLVQRPTDYIKTAPFVPRDVFRLVLKLEAQKALDVNVSALEQRFHVPAGYADDESLNARGELKHLKNNVPGPGTYEVPDEWPVRDVTATPTSAFLSRTQRGHFARASSASLSSPSRFLAIDTNEDKMPRPQTANPALLSSDQKLQPSHTGSRQMQSAPRRRGVHLQIELPELQELQQRELKEDTPECTSYSSLNGNTHTFARSSREPYVDQATAPAVGSYDVKRLWDSRTARTTLGAPSPAVFGASKDKREVTWRPALTPASYTVSTSWDSSRHYAKQKSKVERSAARRKLQKAKLLSRAASSPTLRPPSSEANMERIGSAASNHAEVVTEEEDPFSWLRLRPNGEQRVNLLAAKHGLPHHVKAPRRRSVEIRHSVVNHLYDETIRDLKLEDGDINPVDPVYKPDLKDTRIKVSCRMPGGMLISIDVYGTKKLGRFKEAVLIRQKRFQSVHQFDLYHSTGKKLTALEETLLSCGVSDRTLLQIVPTVTIEVSPQDSTASTQATTKAKPNQSLSTVLRKSPT